ncbi:MAG TPA: TlpA disulfide reductase family protein [Chthonomonadales bacterium]|nr:TlpA disulfide reductase family protein [Chthonomonadales bacterium]
MAKLHWTARTIAVVALLGVMAGAADGAPRYKIGDRIAEFRAPEDNGGVFRTSQLRDRIGVLVFFGTWCPPCNEEAPRLESQIWRKYRSKGVVVVGLAIQEGRDPIGKIRAFRRQHNVTYRLASHERGEQFQRFGFDGVPSIVVIDRRGRYHSNPRSIEELDRVLAQLTR